MRLEKKMPTKTATARSCVNVTIVTRQIVTPSARRILQSVFGNFLRTSIAYGFAHNFRS
jgi:hypothetical protein